MRTIFLCLFIFAGTTLFAQSVNTEKLDAYFEALQAGQKFMGTAAIMKNGEFIYTHAEGFADLEKHKAADMESRYRIGSISKTFTSVLVMQALEEGKLSLEDHLSNYFPKVKNSAQISLRQMLQHQTGIANFTAAEDYESWSTQAQSKEQLLERIYAFDSDFEPGSDTEYSNSNFILLGFILEKVYGQSYGDLLQEKIVQPLGLKRTSIGGPIQVDKNECRSYTHAEEWTLEKETDMSIPGGAGAIVSTAKDLATFIYGLFHGKLVSEASLEEMKTLVNNFGFGMYDMPFDERQGFGHGGAIDGFISQWYYMPESDVVCIMTSNAIDYSNKIIVHNIVAAALGEEIEIPAFTSYAVSPEELALYPGRYTKEDFPLEIDVRIEEGQLSAQATGQSAFTLYPSAQHQFREDRIGILLIFRPEQQEMELQQGGQTIVFTRAAEGE